MQIYVLISIIKGVVRDNTLHLSHTQLSLAGHPVKESVKCKEYA